MNTTTFHLSVTLTNDVAPRFLETMKSYGVEMDGLITMAQACREFGMSHTTLDRWVNHAKVLKATQPVPNGKKYVLRSEIQRLLTVKEEKKATPRRRKSILNPRGEK